MSLSGKVKGGLMALGILSIVFVPKMLGRMVEYDDESKEFIYPEFFEAADLNSDGEVDEHEGKLVYLLSGEDDFDFDINNHFPVDKYTSSDLRKYLSTREYFKDRGLDISYSPKN